MKSNKKIIDFIIFGILELLIILLIFGVYFLLHEKNNYTVIFSNDGMIIKKIKVKKNSTIEKPNDLDKDGYIINKYLLGKEEYNFNDKITNDLVLEVLYEKEGTQEEKNYTIKITPVDIYSPDCYLTVYENDIAIIVKEITYSDGISISASINGTKITVSKADINEETSFRVRLNDDSTVVAKMK